MAWALFEKLKYKSFNAQIRRSVKMVNHIFDTYKNYFMPHGKNIFKTEYDMDMAKMCAYPSSKYVFTTLEICAAVLCIVYTYWYTNYRIRSSRLKV